MEIPADLQQLIDDRTRLAAGALREAIRLDVYRFLASSVEDRLRRRPHFLARTPPQALVAFRGQLSAESDRLIERLGPKIRDLRVFYGAEPRDADRELAGLAKVLGEVEEVARQLLLIWCMPGDDVADTAEDSSVDLSPEYRLRFEVSEAVAWAWRQLRAVDTAHFQITDAEGPVPPKTVEIGLCLPEALPPDYSKRPTID